MFSTFLGCDVLDFNNYNNAMQAHPTKYKQSIDLFDLYIKGSTHAKVTLRLDASNLQMFIISFKKEFYKNTQENM